MSEYINKKAFNDAIREAVRKYPNTFYNGLEVARKIAHDMDAADVAPVRWIPCAERLPEKSGNYLVNIVCPKGKWVEVNCFYADSKDWMTIDDYAEFSTKFVTHWMPLPPPKGEE